MLKLPLWIVTEHIRPSEPEHSPTGKPGSALAFSSSGKLFQFLSANLGGEWKMSMASDRDGLVILIADLHRDETKTLVLDPEKDGTKGEQVSIAQLMELADSLRGKD